jgi:SAM-dependent methyltransferase
MTETFSLTLEQAHAYEDLFVPALFAHWVTPLLESAEIARDQRVLDVACGTGVVARGARRVVGAHGYVCGIDINPAMIQVAHEVDPTIDWCVGDAADLPYEDGTFDAALCQSALFFFPDPVAAVGEMARVVRTGGYVALQTYAGLDEQPGYGLFVEAVVRHAGPRARTLLGTYWSQGDLVAVSRLLEDSGLEVRQRRSILGTVTFPSVDALVHTEIQATPLAHQIGEAAYQAVGQDARTVLAPFVEFSGAVTLPIRARIVSARKRQAAE